MVTVNFKQSKICCISDIHLGIHQNKSNWHKILLDWGKWLDINLKTLNKRIKWNKKRPLLYEGSSQIKINKLYGERKNIYKLAKYKIDCNNLSKESIAKKIISFYEKH